MPQHLDRDAREAGEILDAEHAPKLYTFPQWESQGPVNREDARE
jgi:hypothetical protein